MNIINSKARFSLHPDGRIQDNMTDALYEPDDASTVSDGVHMWDLEALRAALIAGQCVEHAMVGFGAQSEAPRKLELVKENSDVQTDDGAAAGTA